MLPVTSLFQRFERIRIHGGYHKSYLNGLEGTVIWGRPVPRHQWRWQYVVELDTPVENGLNGPIRFPTLFDYNLSSLRSLSSPELHLGTRDEVSFDVVCGREGCLRRLGTFWECYFFDFDLEKNVETISVQTATWQSGITGHLFRVPHRIEICATFVLDTIARLLCMDPIHVYGPDSCSLK